MTADVEVTAGVSEAGAGPPDFFSRFTERQMAFGVIVFGLLLYIPLAGSYGLWDPWETHYSEVARQMTRRGDFISLWWPGSPRDLEVFWSKPVLSFWIMSLGMHIARVGLPGGDPGEMALTHRAEWAVRTPFCLMGVLGIYAVYLVTARFVSRRAGVLAAVVLATAPMYSLVARQAMTDMAFVGPMAMALALGALALFDDRDELLPRRGRGWWSWPDHGLFYGGLVLFAAVTIPQLVIDSIQLKIEMPWHDGTVKMYGAVAMIPYYVGFAAYLFLAARTRYKAPLYLYIAAILCGLAVLAKGLAGLGIAAHRVPSRTWRSRGTGGGCGGRSCSTASPCPCSGSSSWPCLGTTPCSSATAFRSGTSSSATTTGAAWSSAVMAIAGRSSISCASSAMAFCPGSRWRPPPSGGRS